MESEEHVQAVELTVAPLPDRGGADPLFVVLFADRGRSAAAGEAMARSGGGEDAAVAQIEHELRDTREQSLTRG